MIEGVRSRSRFKLIVAFVAVLCMAGMRPSHAEAEAPTEAAVADVGRSSPVTTSAPVQRRFDRSPMVFEENRGQADPAYAFVARPKGMLALIGADAIVLRVARASEADVASMMVDTLRIELAGARTTASVAGLDRSTSTVNYFMGRSEASWTSIPTYHKVLVEDAFPDVDVVYYEHEGQLEYDFVVAPNRPPVDLRLRFEGATSVDLDADGNLAIALPHARLSQHRPRVRARLGDEESTVDCHYEKLGPFEVAIRLGPYDRAATVLIDPVLSYSTYLGGELFDEARAVAVGPDGSAYVTGFTISPNLPVSGSAFQGANAGVIDVFVTKFAPTGVAPLYSTYLGGANADESSAIAVDEAGNAYVAGHTLSADFPVTSAAQPVHGGVSYFGLGDAFVAKLAPNGASLLYSTFLGGSGDDEVRGIAVDAEGSAVVVGRTYSSDFPRESAFQGNIGSPGETFPDAFAAKLAPNGTSLRYSTFLGGEGTDEAYAVAVDADRNAYVGGYTDSEAFPTEAAFQPDGGGDGFLTKLSAEGDLGYSTYFGGSGIDAVYGVAVDAAGRAVAVGETDSADFPLAAPHQDHLGGTYADCWDFYGCGDAFVSRFAADGQGLVFSTYFGGKGTDLATGVSLDPLGNIHVTGNTTSVDLPTADPIQDANGGGALVDAFVVRFSSDGMLGAATYVGGTDVDKAFGIAADSSGSAYVVGVTASADFPTQAPYQPENFGSTDAFLTKVGYGGGLPNGGGPIRPSVGGDTGMVTIGVYGSGFSADAQVKLTRSGEADIEAEGSQTNADGTLVAALLDLRGRARGVWDVVVSGSNGQVVYENGFTIEAGREPDLWVDIVARPRVRVGREEIITVVYGNLGNVDAVLFPLLVHGIPRGTEVSVISPLRDPPQPLADAPIDWDQVPVVLETDGDLRVGVVVSRVPPGASGVLQLRIKAAQEAEFDVRAQVFEPYDEGGTGLPKTFSPQEATLCWGAVASGVATAAGLVPGLTCAQHAVVYFEGVLIDTMIAAVEIHEGHWPIFPHTKVSLGFGTLALECLVHGSPAIKFFQILENMVSIADILYNCWPVLTATTARIKALLAVDPNEKIGIISGGPEHGVRSGVVLPYQIFFENKSSASAPAQEVVITDRLDEHLDLSTLRLGPITIGREVLVPSAAPPPYTGYFDLRVSQGVVAKVEVELDPDTRVLTWRFSSLDPVSNGLPDDPLAGFLPPNQLPPEGEGSVTFTISPARSLPTGTRISNFAEIVFDTNAPIVTPVWSNMIDDEPPHSHAIAGDEVVYETSFEVEWEGTDAGAGIAEYVIMVATDDGPFEEWRRTSATHAVLPGEIGHVYMVATLARDHAGNVEHKELVAEAVVSVQQPRRDEGCGCRTNGRAAPFVLGFLLLLRLRRGGRTSSVARSRSRLHRPLA